MAPIVVKAEGQAHFRQIRRKGHGAIHHRLHLVQLRRRERCGRIPMMGQAAHGQVSGGKSKVWIARQRLPIVSGRAIKKIYTYPNFALPLFEFSFKKQVVGLCILSRSLGQETGFSGR